jgi:hypothetical protein
VLLLVIGYVFEVCLRLTVFAVYFMRFPRMETVSEMLEREVEGVGWRAVVAQRLREQLLADFDPTGGHGKPGR